MAWYAVAKASAQKGLREIVSSDLSGTLQMKVNIDCIGELYREPLQSERGTLAHIHDVIVPSGDPAL
jgi:hypothetical protein